MDDASRFVRENETVLVRATSRALNSYSLCLEYRYPLGALLLGFGVEGVSLDVCYELTVHALRKDG